MVKIPDDMDVPRIRRDTNNSQHPEFKNIFSQVLKLKAKHWEKLR